MPEKGHIGYIPPDPSKELLKQRLGTQEIGTQSFKEIGYLCGIFKLSRHAAIKMCASLHIPLLHVGSSSLFNLSALERALYVLTRYGGPGFVAPASTFKNKQKHKNPAFGSPVTEMTEELNKVAASPNIAFEMLASSGKLKPTGTQLASLIKQMEEKKK